MNTRGGLSKETQERPRTCEGCVKFRISCSRIIIDDTCFQYMDEDMEKEQKEKYFHEGNHYLS